MKVLLLVIGLVGPWAMENPNSAMQKSHASSRLCHASDLLVVIEMGGATGSMVGGIKFLDRHSSPCTLDGRVGIRIRDASNRPLHISYNSVSWNPFTGNGHGRTTSKPDPRAKSLRPSVTLTPHHPAWVEFTWQNFCAGRDSLHYPLHAAVQLPDMHLALVGHPGANPLGVPRCDVPHATSSFVLGPLERYPYH